MMRMRFLIAAAFLLAAGAAFAADQMSVTVKHADVRPKPSFLALPIGGLDYGDRVTVLDQPAGSPKSWLLILGPDGKLKGWVSASVLTTKKIELAAGSENVQQGASSGEVALAGKTWNEDVEKEYRQEDGKVDYTSVDRMEKITVSPEQLSAFIAEGGLSSSAGGTQ